MAGAIAGNDCARNAVANSYARALWLFGGLCFVAILVFHETAASMVSIWWSTPTFAHGFLVLPAAGLLVWLRLREFSGIEVIPEPLAIVPLLGAGLLWLVGEAGGLLVLQHAGLVATLICLAIAVFGRQIARRMWFPLLFLGFMVPIGDQLVPMLQDVTAFFAVTLLGLAGVPILHDGVLIQTPNGLFEVAEACAGVRFLIANMVIASVFAYMSYRTWQKAASFLILSAVLPIVANGIRGFGIIMIAYWTDNEYAAGVDHLVYGWGFFAVVMLTSLYLGSFFADRPAVEIAQTNVGEGGGRISLAPQAWRARQLPLALAMFGTLIAAPLYVATVMGMGQWEAPSHLTALRTAPPWKPVEDGIAAWRPEFHNPTAEVTQTYSNGSTKVRMFIAFYAVQNQGAEVIYHANRFADGERWTRIGTSAQSLSVDGNPLAVKAERMLSRQEGQLTVTYWYWVGGKFSTDPLATKGRQILSALTQTNQAAAVVALAVKTAPGEAFPASVLQDFLSHSPSINAYLRSLQSSSEQDISGTGANQPPAGRG